MAGKRLAALATVLLASAAEGGAPRGAGGRQLPREIPEKVQLPVVAVVEGSSRIPRASVRTLYEYATHQRPANDSAFEVFRLIGAKNMMDARSVAAQHNAPFILRIQLLRRVYVRSFTEMGTGRERPHFNTDVRLELWRPNSSKAAPKGSWKAMARSTARNYIKTSAGLVMGAIAKDSTDKPDTPDDFMSIGVAFVKSLQRAVSEVKTIEVKTAADGKATARVEFTNHANIPVPCFSLDSGRGTCGIWYNGKPLPPGDGEVTVPLRPMRGDDAEKLPPSGPFKGKVNYVHFGDVDKSPKQKEEVPGKEDAKPAPGR